MIFRATRKPRRLPTKPPDPAAPRKPCGCGKRGLEEIARAGAEIVAPEDERELRERLAGQEE